MEKLIQYFVGCGFTEDGARKEVESILRYHTTGIDAVSREYAIEMVMEDLDIA